MEPFEIMPSYIVITLLRLLRIATTQVHDRSFIRLRVQ